MIQERKVILTNTSEDRTALLAILFQYGYIWHKHSHDTTQDPALVNSIYNFSKYPRIAVDPTGSICGTGGTQDYVWPQDAAKIIKDLTAKVIVVNNVGEYTATVSAKNIQVGCQTITWEKFDELVEASKQVRG